MYSFDIYSGFLFSPYLTFPQAPLRSRTVGFPSYYVLYHITNPVLTVAFPLTAFPPEVRPKC